MSDIRNRFGALDRLRAPDLWGEATRRAAAEPVATRSPLGRFALPIIASTVSVMILALLMVVAQPWRAMVGTPARPIHSASASGGPMSLRDAFRARSAYPAGQYWWDPASELWMHKAGAEIGISLGSVNPIIDLSAGETLAYDVAGLPGTWTRLPIGADGVRTEVWSVVIDGTPLTIAFKAQKSATAADIAEVRVIVNSVRTEPWNNRFGFRIVLTLPKGWDSA